MGRQNTWPKNPWENCVSKASGAFFFFEKEIKIVAWWDFQASMGRKNPRGGTRYSSLSLFFFWKDIHPFLEHSFLFLCKQTVGVGERLLSNFCRVNSSLVNSSFTFDFLCRKTS
jgi:hypothetical protein